MIDMMLGIFYIASNFNDIRDGAMSSLQKRAWLMLWSLGPAYLAYFAMQWAAPPWLDGIGPRLACLALASGLHALIYLGGHLWMRWQERGESLSSDERDRAIDGRATRLAYFLLVGGMIAVGVVMPFNRSGWQIVNAALGFIVASEMLRHALIVQGYRAPRHAH